MSNERHFKTKRTSGWLMFTVKWQPSQRGHHKKLSVGKTRSIKKFNASERKLDTPFHGARRIDPFHGARHIYPFHGARHSYAQVVSTSSMEQDIPMLKSYLPLPWSKTYLPLPWSKTFLCSGHIYPFHAARHSYAQVISVASVWVNHKQRP